jgi:hypothetical protein
MIEEDGDYPKDFDYFKGYFIDHLISCAQALAAWDKAGLMDIRHLGLDSPEDDPDGNLEADQYPKGDNS